MIVGTSTGLQVAPEEFTLLRDFIHERSGIYLDEHKSYLVRDRLEQRLDELGLHSIRDYYYQVKYDRTGQEFNRLMSLMTTNETCFFRSKPQLACLAEEVLPALLTRRGSTPEHRRLRIWSAGCSSGEEPYTLAMLVLEYLGSADGWDIEVIASDISEDALARARRGEYSGHSLRKIRPEMLEKYFDRSGETYSVKENVRSLVRFQQANLCDDEALASEADIVFCCNVMIYFSEGARRQVVRKFYDALCPGGYLFIGHSETLHGISKAYRLVYFKNALVYQREGAEQPRMLGEPGSDGLNFARPVAIKGAAERATRVLELLNRTSAASEVLEPA